MNLDGLEFEENQHTSNVMPLEGEEHEISIIITRSSQMIKLDSQISCKFPPTKKKLDLEPDFMNEDAGGALQIKDFDENDEGLRDEPPPQQDDS
jgi:hypothetical protein